MDNDPDATEAEIWRRALSRDGYAFAELFEMHQARVYRRALGLLENVHDAEEVTSSVFFELWRKQRAVRLVEGSVLPWLIVTTVNTARNHRRSTVRYRRLVASLPRGVQTADAQLVALGNLENEVLGIRLANALAQVAATDVALLVLTAFDGLSVAQAANAVGIKPGTARMRLHRTRQRLQADLADDHQRSTTPIIEGDRA